VGFYLVNAAKSRSQQLAVVLLRAPHVMLAESKELRSSEDWLLATLCNMSEDLNTFTSLKQVRHRVCNFS
jgi:hypothetical protein